MCSCEYWQLLNWTPQAWTFSVLRVCLTVFSVYRNNLLSSDHFVSDVFHVSHVSQLLVLSPLLLGKQGLSIDTHDLLPQTLLLFPLLLQGLEEDNQSEKKQTAVLVYGVCGCIFLWACMCIFSFFVCAFSLRGLCPHLEVSQVQSLLVLSYLLSLQLFCLVLQLLLLQTLLDLVVNLLHSTGK